MDNSTNINQFQLFKKGDERAFGVFFKAHYNSIVGFCKQFIGDEDKAKSVAQEAFIKLWINRRKVEKIHGIKSFLYTSAKTECLNILRHKIVVNKYNSIQLQKQESQLNQEILNTLNFDEVSISELEKQIEESITGLPEKCKLVFIKSRRENKKNKEIAEELNISIKAVESHITKALKIMRKELAAYLPTVLIGLILTSF